MNIKELLAAIEKAMGEVTELETTLEATKTDAERLVVQKSIDEKLAEVRKHKDALEPLVKKAEQNKEVQALIARTKAASAVDVTNKSLNAKTVVADAVDHVAVMHKQLDVCHKYLSTPKNKQMNLSDQELDLVRPKSESFKSGASGVALPLMTTIKMFGPKWARQVGFGPTQITAAIKASTMVSSSDALGGYTVPEEFLRQMIDLPTETPHILQRATVLPCTTGELTIPRSLQTDSDEFGGMSGSWIDEAGAKTKSDTQFEQVKIPAHEYAMYTQISIRLLERSAIAMENWIVSRGKAKCLDAMDLAFINGDGDGKPTGILQTAGIRSVGRQTASTMTRRDAVRLKYALKPYHRASGVYVMHDDCLQALEELEDAERRPLFAQSMANGAYDKLCGYPYIVTTRNPTIGKNGDCFFADLREYYVAMEQEVVAKRSDDYDIIHNVATIVIFVVVGGEFVEPRVAAELVGTGGS